MPRDFPSIALHLGDAKGYADVAKGGKAHGSGKIVTVSISHVEYETASRRYAHTDVTRVVARRTSRCREGSNACPLRSRLGQG